LVGLVNTVLKRRACVTAQDLTNGSGDTVITFEDLHLQDQAMGPLPSGYMGFIWSDSAWFVTKAFSSSIWPGGGRIGLLNAHGKDIIMESKRPFDLKGLSLCTLWTDKAQVLVEGWEKEVRKYATTQVVSRALTIRCALDYRDVDRVELKANGVHLVISTINVLVR
jgi:hypothetical protein